MFSLPAEKKWQIYCSKKKVHSSRASLLDVKVNETEDLAIKKIKLSLIFKCFASFSFWWQILPKWEEMMLNKTVVVVVVAVVCMRF